MLIALIVFTFIFGASSERCSLDPTRDQSPFILDDNFNFPNSFNFNVDELFYVACPPGTYSSDLLEDGDHVICKNNTTIANVRNLQLLDFNQIKCESKLSHITKKLNKQCENNGTLAEVGYQVYNKFVSEVTICSDDNKVAPFYVKYNNFWWNSKKPIGLVNSSSSSYDTFICSESKRKCEFAKSQLFQNIDFDEIYNNQDQILTNLGLSFYKASLLRYPLATEIYGITPPQQIQELPYWDYSHVVPIWDRVFNEWFLYYFSNFLGSSASVLYSGTLGVTTLINENGVLTEVYLNDGQVPVPKWLWSISRDTILVLYNSPLTMITEYEELCDTLLEAKQNVFTCELSAVIHPELRAFIDNNINKNDCGLQN